MQLNLLAIPLLLASAVSAINCNEHYIVVDDESFQYLTTGIKVKCDQPLSRVDFRAFPRHGTTEVPNSSVYAARTTSANNLYTGRLYFPPNIVRSYEGLNFCVSYQAYDQHGVAAPLAGGCRTTENSIDANGGQLSCAGCPPALEPRINVNFEMLPSL